MLSPSRKQIFKDFKWFWIVGTAGLILYLTLNLINDRFQMHDLEVYHGAWQELLKSQSPYGQSFGLSSGFYKYAPLPALLFSPLFAFGWLPARIIYFVLIGFSILLTLPRILREIKVHWPVNRSLLVIILTLGMLGGHLSRELLLGNVNWLLFVGLLIVFRFREERSWLGGLVLGMLFTCKPHFIFLLPWFVARGKWKLLLWGGGSFAVGLFLPALLFGWSKNYEWLQLWLEAMQSHNVNLWESANTIYHLIDELTLHAISGINNGGTILIGLGLTISAVSISGLMIKHGGFFKRAYASQEQLEFFLILGLIPNLVHTDTEHFLWGTPLIMIFVSFLTRYRWLWLVFFLCMIPYALATPDLWGRAVAEWLIESGSIGLANLVMLGTATVLSYRVITSFCENS